jgi:hypothetical protein
MTGRSGRTTALVFAACTWFGSAQSPLFQDLESPFPRSFPAAPSSVADYDADGDLDALGVFGLSFRLLENDGSGVFRLQGPIVSFAPGNPTFQGTAPADYDGDGLSDVAVAVLDLAPSTVRVMVFRNLGAAGFTPMATLFPAACSLCNLKVFAFDADNDGDADLLANVMGPFAATTHVMYRNDGGFVFSEVAGAVPTGLGTPSFVAADDINGDGLLDLYAAPIIGPAGVRVLANTGGCTFSPGVFAPSPIATTTMYGVGDFNGDGTTDFVMSSGTESVAGPETIVSFAGGTATTISSIPRPAGDLATFGADVDADGSDEVVRFRARTMAVDSPTVALDLPIAAAQGATGPHGFVFDVDADGDADIAYRGGAAATWRIFHNRGDGTLLDVSGLTPAGFRIPLGPVARSTLIDLEGDGDVDVLASVLGSGPGGLGPLQTVRNDGAGTFDLLPPATPAAFFVTPPLAVGDFDGDGDGDFAMRGSFGLDVRIGDGAGGFTSQLIPTPQTFGGWDGGIAADFNGDGSDDPAFSVSTPTAKEVWVFLSGAGTTAVLMVAASAPGVFPYHRLAAFDAEGDGDLDLAAPRLGAPAEILINDGNGSFLVTQPFGVATGNAVSTGDVDGDGDEDVYLGVSGGLMLRQGSTYVPGPPVPPATSPALSWVLLADLDLDGMADLLGSDVWRPATGAGLFGPSESLPAVSGDWKLADFDGDEDLDLYNPNGAIVWNARRHLSQGAPPALGRVASLELRGPANGLWDLVFATAPASPPFKVAPWGLVRVDPATAFIAVTGVTDASGAAAVPFAIPALPALLGMTFYWQAGFREDVRLSGLEKTTILSL